MMLGEATALGSVTVRVIRARAFRTCETTLDQEAERFRIADVRATINALRAMSRATLDSLSERAFETQPTVADAAIWSAGQIVAHLAASQADLFLNPIRASLHLPRTPTDDYSVSAGDGPLSRAATLAILDAADRDLARFFADLPPNVDPATRVPHHAFDSIGLGGLLLFAAIHEEDHWGQLNGLR